VVLKARAVMLTTLPAALLKEASYGSTTRVLYVTIPVRDLEPPELNYSRDISVDYTLYIEGPL